MAGWAVEGFFKGSIKREALLAVTGGDFGDGGLGGFGRGF
jgi:hypothetical protein